MWRAQAPAEPDPDPSSTCQQSEICDGESVGDVHFDRVLDARSSIVLYRDDTLGGGGPVMYGSTNTRPVLVSSSVRGGEQRAVVGVASPWHRHFLIPARRMGSDQFDAR
ncbi:hypothetical protein PHYPSEUDO_006496 [Phytophthora pseudosyringae]|uniref:Uncharacterized protein n=1 Tax=Phytophthora pseudosyringae TaxID=221518 RepID=A0A8T1VIN0_9STRA|nr:hypothetical protein PHYPSEUDO_006496 [Phytophthora pseudosyringae]